MKMRCAALAALVWVAPAAAFIPLTSNSERVGAFLLTVVTNLALIPGIMAYWRAACEPDAVLGACATLASACYHWLQVAADFRPDKEHTFLFGGWGDWHRVDNVFGATSTMVGAFQLAQLDARAGALLRLSALASAATAQFLHPWALWFTAVPVVVHVGVAFALRARQPAPLQLDDAFAARAALAATATLVFFLLGLDDSRDYLRAWHGCFHLALGALSYYWCKLCNPPGVIKLRRANNSAYSQLNQF